MLAASTSKFIPKIAEMTGMRATMPCRGLFHHVGFDTAFFQSRAQFINRSHTRSLIQRRWQHTERDIPTKPGTKGAWWGKIDIPGHQVVVSAEGGIALVIGAIVAAYFLRKEPDNKWLEFIKNRADNAELKLRDARIKIKELEKEKHKLRVYTKCGSSTAAKECLHDIYKFFREGDTVTFDTKHPSPEFIEALAEALLHDLNPNVTGLSFYGTYIWGSGKIDSLLRSIQKSPSIRLLDLSYTDIPPKEASAVIRMLENNQTLKKIKFSYVDIRDSDVSSFKDLKGRNALKILDLSDTRVTEAGKKELRDALGIDVK